MKEQLIEELRNALAQDNFSDALSKAKQLIDLDPTDHRSYLLFGDVFVAMDNESKAIEQYEKASSIQPGDAEVFFKLGNAFEMKEDFQNALSQYKTACRLDPNNPLYSAYMGRALNRKGLESGNINFENDGLALMEKAFHAGVSDANLREQLSIAHLGQALSSWAKHPEQEGYFVATEPVHLQNTKTHLEWVKNLYDRSNQAIGQRLAEIEGFVQEAEKRQFGGYPYLRKVPFVTGVIFLVFGLKVLAVVFLLMGVLYHFSQVQPQYLANRRLIKGNYREPFIVRRLNQVDQELSGITIFSSTWSGLFFNKLLFNLVAHTLRYGMALMFLPYEIIKGFMKNYDFWKGGKTPISVGIFLTSCLCATASLSSQTLPFCDDFESDQLQAPWTARPNLSGANGLVEVTDVSPHSGQYALAMGKSSELSGLTTNALDLRLNLQGQTRVELTFWIYDYGDETHQQDGLYFSNDGGATFKKVLDFRPQDWCDYDYGQFPPIEVHKLAAKAGLTLTSQFVIRWQQHDDGDFNGSNADGFLLDDVCVHVPCTAYFPLSANKPFSDGFESGKYDCNWAWRFADATNTLAAVPTRPSNYTGVAAFTPHEGQYAASLGKTCEDGFATNALDLHLNLNDQTRVELTFWLYDYADETQQDDGLYFSNDGGLTFKKIFDFRPGDWCDYQYGQYPPLEIHKLAAKVGLSFTDKCIIRWQQHDDGDFNGSNADGLVLDDVRVYVPTMEYFPLSPTKPFDDGFETGKLGINWAWRFADITNTLAAVPTRPSNYTAVAPFVPHTGQYAAFMGKTCEDGFATNALDLHLNLKDQTRVELIFWLYHYADETQQDDGLYFSNDGGLTFKKIFDFRPGDWCAYQYGQYPPLEIHKLASKVGLPFTDKCIIRWQQHDDGDFNGSNADGLALDDVRVYVPVLQYATLPFMEDFETGENLRPMWACRFADSTALPAQHVTRPSNYLYVEPSEPHTGQYAVSLGKICEDGFATNALDLHLKLAGMTAVKLKFWLYVYAEETQIQDGIWLSNDGGLTFKKIYAFDFETNEDYQYYPLELNLSALAGFPLTDQTIVRFQQHDDGDFNGSNADGLTIDDIMVTGMVSSTTETDHLPLAVFPNPAQDVLTVQGLPRAQTSLLQVFDAQGSLVMEQTASGDVQLDVRHLPLGLYLLKSQTEGQTWQGKFLIAR